MIKEIKVAKIREAPFCNICKNEMGLNSRNLYIDSETVGLNGGCKLIQYALDDGPVVFIKLFTGWWADLYTVAQLYKLLELVDSPDTVLVCFNASFDIFVLLKVAHKLRGYDYDSKQRAVEPFKCKVLDLQVHAMLKSPLAPFAFNRAGARSVALVRRIPKVAQEYVADVVSAKLKPLLPNSFSLGVGIHKVVKCPELVTLSFKVEGRLSLKGLMKEYGLETIKLDEVWPLPKREDEKPWLPYPDPKVHDPIEAQCDSILAGPEDSAFYRYSKLDILYLKVLYEKLGRPAPDYNSACVHNQAYLRYYGLPVGQQALAKAEDYYGSKVQEIEYALAGVNLRSSTERLALLKPHFPILASTAKVVLKELAKEDSEGGRLCKAIVEYGPARQRLLQIQKVRECRTGRAHPDLRVMGTATNRMAGASGLNWQGIGAVAEFKELEDEDFLPENDRADFEEDIQELLGEIEEGENYRTEKIGLRSCILTPCVGDWSSFEVRIAAQVYDDKQLQQDLRDGIDLHCMTTATAHPEALKRKMSYEDICLAYAQHDKQVTDWRKQMKAVVFGIFYFASAMKVGETLGVPEFEAQKVLDRFYARYKSISLYRQKIEQRFITADTERWTESSVRKMDSLQTDLTGFERRWNFEKDVASSIWELGHNKRIHSGLSGQVVRTQAKGPQSIDMAITSACLGSAIAIQAACSRQAGNMPVQATGSSLTKMLQAVIWEKLRVPTLQCHDEIICTEKNFNWGSYSALVDGFVRSAQSVVPMLAFDYKLTENWADK